MEDIVEDSEEGLDQYYYKIQTKCSIYDELVRLANDPKDWYENFGFIMKNIPDSLINTDPVLKQIIKKFPEQKYASRSVLLKLNPYIFYREHKDEGRTCAINLLVKGQGITFFSGKVLDSKGEKSEYLFKINQLDYEPESYYLLNTRKYHAVVNLEQERIIFSLTFTPPGYYNSVKKFLEGNKL